MAIVLGWPRQKSHLQALRCVHAQSFQLACNLSTDKSNYLDMNYQNAQAMCYNLILSFIVRMSFWTDSDREKDAYFKNS